MGIRNTSFYGWTDVLKYHPVGYFSSSLLYVSVDGDDVYAVTRNPAGIIKYSSVSNTFKVIPTNGIPSNTNDFKAVINSQYGLLVAGDSLYKSIDEGLNWTDTLATNLPGASDYVGDVLVLDGDYLPAAASYNPLIYAAARKADAGSDIKYLIVFSSSDGGTTWGSGSSVVDSDDAAAAEMLPYRLALGLDVSAPVLYLLYAYNESNETTNWAVEKSKGNTTYPPGGSAGSAPWGNVFDEEQGVGTSEVFELYDLATSQNGQDVYFVGAAERGLGGDVDTYIYSSSDEGVSYASGTLPFRTTTVYGASYFGGAAQTCVGVTEDNTVFVIGPSGSDDDGIGSLRWRAYSSVTSGSAWNLIASEIFDDTSFSQKMTIASDNRIYVGGTRFGSTAVLRTGKLSANSASLGPIMLASSIGYVQGEVAGSVVEKFKLNNVSEFPHSGGAFQMRNLILGTQDSGQIGNTEDHIIQVSHLGSVVHIMWPNQAADVESFVKGFGSFSIGQKSGKLESNWSSGSFFDVTEFDHLTLYGYLAKQVSGTLDNVDIRIERRPVRDAPFAVDQAIEYSTSGSHTLATYKDLIHTKEIDYGDLSIREIGWPMDIPLVNVKELRTSARHRIGQTEDKNKNFILWGRLIKSAEET